MAISTETTLYGRFSTEEIFDSPHLNTFFNQLYQLLISAFSETEVLEHLLIDGGVALELQSEDPGDINHIEMTFTSEKMYKFLSASIHGLPISSAELSGGYLIVKVQGVIVRFGLVLGTVSKVTVKNLSLRNKTEISL